MQKQRLTKSKYIYKITQLNPWPGRYFNPHLSKTSILNFNHQIPQPLRVLSHSSSIKGCYNHWLMELMKLSGEVLFHFLGRLRNQTPWACSRQNVEAEKLIFRASRLSSTPSPSLTASFLTSLSPLSLAALLPLTPNSKWPLGKSEMLNDAFSQ